MFFVDALCGLFELVQDRQLNNVMAEQRRLIVNGRCEPWADSDPQTLGYRDAFEDLARALTREDGGAPFVAWCSPLGQVELLQSSPRRKCDIVAQVEIKGGLHGPHSSRVILHRSLPERAMTHFMALLPQVEFVAAE